MTLFFFSKGENLTIVKFNTTPILNSLLVFITYVTFETFLHKIQMTFMMCFFQIFDGKVTWQILNLRPLKYYTVFFGFNISSNLILKFFVSLFYRTETQFGWHLPTAEWQPATLSSSFLSGISSGLGSTRKSPGSTWPRRFWPKFRISFWVTWRQTGSCQSNPKSTPVHQGSCLQIPKRCSFIETFFCVFS